MKQKEIDKQLRYIRRMELYLTNSILQCSDCNIVAISTKHPVILRQKDQNKPYLCQHHKKMIDNFNHKYGSD